VNLDELLATSRALGAEWSISVRRNDQPDAFLEHEPAKLLRTASVAKVFVLMELADRLAAKEIAADQLVDRRGTPAVLDSGLWRAMRADSFPVTDLAVLVGAHSDNWATNALIDLCGLECVQARARASAPGGSMLYDHVRDDRSGDVPATLSVGSAQDWVGIVQGLCYADTHADRQVLEWLSRGADLSMVASAFDLDPLAHDTDDLGLRLWHKTGTDRGVRADVGVVAAGSTAVSYAAIGNWPPADARAGVRRAVLSTMRGIGEEIRSAVLGEGR